MTRLTLSALRSLFSGMTVWKPPLVNSDSGEVASLFRSSDLGVMMTSGLRSVAHHLAAQHVEDLAGRGRLHHLHVGVGRQLHEALQARRAVLRALAFVAVRQHQRDAVDAAPLHFARGDELVDHHLGAVDEVAELRFPDHQRVGVVGGVAVLEAQHRFFGQDRVDHDERAPGSRRRSAAACRCRCPTSRGSGRAAPHGGGVKVPRPQSSPDRRTG